MERKVHWVSISRDKKIGKVMASYSPLDTCPDSCGFKTGGCYGWALFYIRILGEKIDDGRINIRNVFSAMDGSRRKARIARHRIVGDIVGDAKETYDECRYIEDQGLINIGYTHNWEADDAQILKDDFRASCNSIEEAEKAISMGWGVTLSVFGNKVPKKTEIAGQSAFLCPARHGVAGKKDINCDSCTLCRIDDKTRNKIVMFETHGTPSTINDANVSSVDMDSL
jgi:hypothetical protein